VFALVSTLLHHHVVAIPYTFVTAAIPSHGKRGKKKQKKQKACPERIFSPQ
jgi:uncharacterized membrane protein